MKSDRKSDPDLKIIEGINRLQRKIKTIDLFIVNQQSIIAKKELFAIYQEIENIPGKKRSIDVLIKTLLSYLVIPYSYTALDLQVLNRVSSEFVTSKLMEKYLENFKNLLTILKKKYPSELKPYASHVIFILSRMSVDCIRTYNEKLATQKAGENKAEMDELLFTLLHIRKGVENLVFTRKNENDRITKAANVMIASLGYVFTLKTVRVREQELKNNYNTFISLFDGKTSRILYESKRIKKTHDDICFDYWLDFHEFCIVLNDNFKENKAIEGNILSAMKEYDFEKLMAFLDSLDTGITGENHASLMIDNPVGIALYAELFEILADFIMSSKKYYDTNKLIEYRKKIVKFNNSFYQCDIIRQYFDEQICNIRKNYYKNETADNTHAILALYSDISIDVEKMLKNKNNLLLKKSFDIKINEIGRLADFIPENDNLVGLMYASLSYYYGKENLSYLQNYISFTIRVLTKMKVNGYPQQHQDFVWNFLTAIMWDSVNSYQYSPSNDKNHYALKLLVLIKEIISLHFYDKNNSSLNIMNLNSIQLAATLSWLHQFIPHVEKYNHDGLLDAFVDSKSFKEIWKNATNLFSKECENKAPGEINSDLGALFCWFAVIDCHCSMLQHKSAMFFNILDYEHLLSFLEHKSVNNSYNINIDNPCIYFSMRMEKKIDLTLGLIISVSKLIVTAETFFKTRCMEFKAGTFYTDNELKENWLNLYMLYGKFLDFKERYYSLPIIKYRYTNITCDERVSDTNKEKKLNDHRIRLIHEIQKIRDDVNNNRIRIDEETFKTNVVMIFEIIRKICDEKYVIEDGTKQMMRTHLALLSTFKNTDNKKFHDEFSKTLMCNNHEQMLNLMQEFDIIFNSYGFEKDQADMMMDVICGALYNPEIKNNKLLLWAVILNPSIHGQLHQFRPDEYHIIILNNFKFYGIDDELHDLERLIILSYYKLYHSQNHFLFANFYEVDYQLVTILMQHYQNIQHNIETQHAYDRIKSRYLLEPRFFTAAGYKTIDNGEMVNQNESRPVLSRRKSF